MRGPLVFPSALASVRRPRGGNPEGAPPTDGWWPADLASLLHLELERSTAQPAPSPPLTPNAVRGWTASRPRAHGPPCRRRRRCRASWRPCRHRHRHRHRVRAQPCVGTHKRRGAAPAGERASRVVGGQRACLRVGVEPSGTTRPARTLPPPAPPPPPPLSSPKSRSPDRQTATTDRSNGICCW